MSRSKKFSIGLLALIVISVSACATAPGQPSSSGSYSVLVDLFSGRENPKVQLSSGVAERIYANLDGRATEFQAAVMPDPKGGFRGFVITASGNAKPVLRVTKNSVFSIRDGTYEMLADPTGEYYNLVLNDVKSQLSGDVLNALDYT